MLNFLTVAVFYLLLGAPFIALSQVTVYAGAIMVLFLFVIMLLGAEKLPQASGAALAAPLAASCSAACCWRKSVTWLWRGALTAVILPATCEAQHDA